MIVSVYIERYLMDVMECYGTVEEVINRMLDEADKGNFDVFDKPSAGSRTEDCVRIDVNITNESYLELLNSFPSNSPRISLRRYVHWFINNEMHHLLGWEIVNEYGKKYKDRAVQSLVKAEHLLMRAKNAMMVLGDFSHENWINKLINEIKTVRGDL